MQMYKQNQNFVDYDLSLVRQCFSEQVAILFHMHNLFPLQIVNKKNGKVFVF